MEHTERRRTGGDGGRWVEYTRPKPRPVVEVEDFWGTPPPAPSERCRWWVEQIENGWRPNRSIRANGYHSAAEWYGVWIWEYNNVVGPAVLDHPTNQET